MVILYFPDVFFFSLELSETSNGDQ